MSTRLEITSWVREATLLSAADVASTVIESHINRAIEIVGARFPWPFLEDVGTDDSVVGTQTIEKPATSVFIDAILEGDARTRLREVTPQQALEEYGDDPPDRQPDSFYLWDDLIWFTTIPIVVDTYKIKFHIAPTALSADGDSPQWNAQHHMFLADYSIARLWEREEDSRAAGAADQRFEMGLGLMAQHYLNQAADGPMVWGETPNRTHNSAYGNMPWLDGAT